MRLSSHNKALLESLRNDIKNKHQEIEELTEGHLLMSHPSKVRYERFLLNHFCFHKEVAHQLQIAHEKEKLSILDWPECGRINALRKDLIKMNLLNEEHMYEPVSAFHSVDFAIGMCYVAEGSSMGNKMILAHLEKHDHFSSWGAQHFLVSSKENLSERWKNFQSILVEALSRDYEEVKMGSIYGFDLFEEITMKNKVVS